MADVPRMLSQYLMGVIKGVLRLFKEFSKDASRLAQGCFQDDLRGVQGCVNGAAWMLWMI